MKLPLSWLKEYIDLEVSLEELEKKLFSSGFEVEEVVYLGKEISNCVVGQITHIEKHPDSDHLQICKLNCGSFGENIQIVTGAQNVFEGAKVPVALNNSTLAGGVKIKNGKLRGVDSFGMLCSGGELGITEEFFPNGGIDGILILPDNTEVGTDIKKVVGLDDYVFDISITANRPDCQSVYGMAREISAILGTKLRSPDVVFTEKQHSETSLNVKVLANDLCPRYIAHTVENINIAPSPVWLRQRLMMCDIQPINNIVDITNYVLLELGQPMHAFDYAKLSENEIVVRRANKGETIKTLDEKEFSLTENNLVICDGKEPVALAGIMGGLESGISENTKNIVFESAKFMRENIRKTSRSLGQSSDSSHRFEKGVDEFTTEIAMKRALNLVFSLKAGEITTIHFDIANNKNPAKQVIETKLSKINKLLGIEVPANQIENILTRLNFEVSIKGDDIIVKVPLYREDIDGYADLAEEVIRIYGFDNIKPQVLPNTKITKGGLPFEIQMKNKARNVFVAQGYSEIMTYSFFGEKDLDLLKLPKDAKERTFVPIANPLTEDNGIMKTTLVASTLAVINRNLKKGVEAGKIFEIANIFAPITLPVNDFPIETKTISIGLFGKKYNFFDIKGAIEVFAKEFKAKITFAPTTKSFFHPYQSANIMLGEDVVGFVGKIAYDITDELSLNEPIFIAEINFEKIMKNYNNSIVYKPISKFNDIKRDLALVANKATTCGEIEEVIKMSSKKISEIQLFDIYEGEQVGQNEKSLAFTITFSPKDEAITHEEVDGYVAKILKNLKEKLDVNIR